MIWDCFMLLCVILFGFGVHGRCMCGVCVCILVSAYVCVLCVCFFFVIHKVLRLWHVVCESACYG